MQSLALVVHSEKDLGKLGQQQDGQDEDIEGGVNESG
jgi:hypothetical protein